MWKAQAASSLAIADWWIPKSSKGFEWFHRRWIEFVAVATGEAIVIAKVKVAIVADSKGVNPLQHSELRMVGLAAVKMVGRTWKEITIVK